MTERHDIIYDLLKEQRADTKLLIDRSERIETQVYKTNGRVSSIEARENELKPIREDALKRLGTLEKAVLGKDQATINRHWWATWTVKDLLPILVSLLILALSYVHH